MGLCTCGSAEQFGASWSLKKVCLRCYVQDEGGIWGCKRCIGLTVKFKAVESRMSKIIEN